MKKYIYTKGNHLLVVNNDNFTDLDTIANSYLNVDWCWLIREDGVFIFKGKEYEVKRGDIIYILYAVDGKGDREVAIVNSPEILKNTEEREAYMAKERDKECESCPCCDNCKA